jgi:hypothetical protein
MAHQRTIHLVDPDPIGILLKIVSSLSDIATIGQGISSQKAAYQERLNTIETRRIAIAARDMRTAISQLEVFWTYFSQLGETRVPAEIPIRLGTVQKFLTEEEYRAFLDGFDVMLQGISILNHAIYQINFSNLLIDEENRRRLISLSENLRGTCNNCIFGGQSYEDVVQGSLPKIIALAREVTDLLALLTSAR